MSLSGKDVAEIARLLDGSHFTSLDLTVGDFRLKIRREGAGGGRWVGDADDGEEERASDRPAPRSTAPPIPPRSAASAAGVGEVDVPAPLLGNFYSAPRPGEDPFVAVGDRVTPDTIVAIIEVMKLMNSVRAGVAGTLVAVLAENGSAVEEGQPLFRVKAD